MSIETETESETVEWIKSVLSYIFDADSNEEAKARRLQIKELAFKLSDIADIEVLKQ